ncbi:MAG: LptF/LptG family permease [Planctomycetota bacterium]
MIPGLGLVDRWLLRRFFGAFLAFLCVGALLFIAVDLPINMWRLERSGLARSIPLRYGTQLPELFFVAAPYLTLLSGLWVVASLRRSNELLGLLSVGYSSRRVAWPLLLGALMTAPVIWVDRELLLPALGEMRREAAGLGGRKGAWRAPRPVPDAKGGVFFPVGYSPQTREVRELSFVRLDEHLGAGLSVHAERAEYEPPAEGRPGGWRLSNGAAIARPAPGAPPEAERLELFGARGYLLETSVIPADVEAADTETYAVAAELRARLQRTPGFVHLEVELWQRFSQPLGGAALLLFSLPLLLGFGDARVVLRGVLCVGAAFCYFLAVTLCAELGGRGVLAPGFAAWLPPLAWAACGVVFALGARA